MGKRRKTKRRNARKKRLNKKGYSLNKTISIKSLKKSSLRMLTLKTPLKVFKGNNIINDLIQDLESSHI